MRGVLIVAALATGLAAQTPVIIDTDAGSDDLMAIAFLLSRKDVKVEAITVVDGLAHVPAGAKNILRALELAGCCVCSRWPVRACLCMRAGKRLCNAPPRSLPSGARRRIPCLASGFR